MVVVGILPIDPAYAALGARVKFTAELSDRNWTFEFIHNAYEDSWTLLIGTIDGTNVFNQKVVLGLDYVIEKAFVLTFRDLDDTADAVTKDTLGSSALATFIELEE